MERSIKKDFYFHYTFGQHEIQQKKPKVRYAINQKATQQQKQYAKPINI